MAGHPSLIYRDLFIDSIFTKPSRNHGVAKQKQRYAVPARGQFGASCVCNWTGWVVDVSSILHFLLDY